jgi:hypothetical protein
MQDAVCVFDRQITAAIRGSDGIGEERSVRQWFVRRRVTIPHDAAGVLIPEPPMLVRHTFVRAEMASR